MVDSGMHMALSFPLQPPYVTRLLSIWERL